jgi:cytochrome P450
MAMAEARGADVPVSNIDPFADAFLSDPYPFHAQLREAGPVVWLERYRLYAMARHAHVHAALSDWQTYSSAAGVGMDDFRKTKPWRPPSILLEVDPPLHDRTRSAMGRVLSVAAVKRLRERFRAQAERLVDALVRRETFDAITDLAEPYPIKVFGDAVGLPEEGRENLLPYSNMVFNSFGPRNARFTEAVANAEPVLKYIFAMCERGALSADGFGADIYATHDAGEITAEEAPILVRSLLTAGMDTTVNGLGNALYAFATHPDEWRRFRADAAARKWAFDEVIRWESPVQTFFRTTTRDVGVEGVTVPEGAKVLLFLAAANRDPRQFPDPERFDIARLPGRHVAFGTGIHNCVGQMLARMEAEVVLGAFAERVAAIELAAAPERRLNNTLRGFARLPLRVRTS